MRRLAWTYLVAVHIALVLSVIKADLPSKAAVKLGLAEEPDWPGIALMRDVQRQTDPNVPSGSVLFLGDSLTQFFPTSAVFPKSVNYGIAGQRTDQLLVSIGNYHSMARASLVVITIGTNDVLQGRAEGIEARYRAILSKVPSSVPVVLSGIPRLTSKDVSPVVASANAVCMDSPRCMFVDAGNLDLLPDGVHISPMGYQEWAASLTVAVHASASTARP